MAVPGGLSAVHRSAAQHFLNMAAAAPLPAALGPFWLAAMLRRWMGIALKLRPLAALGMRVAGGGTY